MTDHPTPPPTADGDTDSTALTLAIIGLALACVPLVGLILGIVVVLRPNAKGVARGLGIAAIVLSVLEIVLITVIWITVALDGPARDANGVITDAGNVDSTELQLGDCVMKDELDDNGQVAAVPCRDAHKAEVFAIFSLPDGPWRGAAVVDRLSDGGCTARFERFYGEVYSASSNQLTFFDPTRDTWSEDRTVQCLAAAPSEVRGHLPRQAGGKNLSTSPLDHASIPFSSMKVGECARGFSDARSTVDLMPCDKPHRAEAFARWTLPSGPFPGESQTDRAADGGCRTRFAAFVGRDFNSSNLDMSYAFPDTLDSWKQDRSVVCVLKTKADVTGTLKDSRR